MMARQLATAILALIQSTAALALEPERREVTVIHAHVWEGDTYKEIFIPSSRPDMVLMAGADNAVSFVETLEYYWPLSRQVYVDLEARREERAGLVTITSGSEVVAEIEPETWSILYPDGAIRGRATLLWGEAAIKGHEDNVAEQLSFNRRMMEAQRAHRAYERKLLETGAARQDGEAAPMIAPPPPLPEASLRLVTEPRDGYRINLPPGDYQIAFSVSGEDVPGTRKQLRVVAPVSDLMRVADIIPEERWTRPIPANRPASRVYVRPGAVFYVTLAQASQVLETDYLPVVSPQSSPLEGRMMWIRRGEAVERALRLSWGDRPEGTNVEREPLKVEQTRGSGFGYAVRRAAGDERADMEAFAIQVPQDQDVTRGRFAALDAGADAFAREVVIVHPRNGLAGFLLAFVPVSAFLVLWAMSWARRPRGDAVT